MLLEDIAAFGSLKHCVQYNWLDSALPEYPKTHQTVARNAAIGLSASTAAAFASNWTRVIKTAKQTQEANASYLQVAAPCFIRCFMLVMLAASCSAHVRC